MSDLSSFLSTRNKDWSAELWDGLIEAIGARLAPLEEQLNIQKEVTDAIIARGLTIIEQELAPIIEQADDILGKATTEIEAKIERFEHKVTGGTVLSYSTSPATVENGRTINIILAKEDREFFSPTPYLSLSRATTIATWAIGKLVSFNRVTGALAMTLEQVTGAGGPFSDWVITSLPGATLLQKAYYEQTLALRHQVADDKVSTGQDKSAAAASAATASDAASTAVQAKNASVFIHNEMRLAIAEPLVEPENPVIGQIWYDGSVTRVFDGTGFVPTVTVSIGGRRYEQGVFTDESDGVVTVGGGFTAAMVFLNGALLREGSDYTATSPDVMFVNWQEGDAYFIEAYEATDGTDYYTKQQVDQRIANATSNGWASQPVGVPIPVFSNLAGVNLPPKDKAYKYVLLTAGQSGAGGYNQGLINTETVAGSAPNITATAKVMLAGSPMNGTTINLLNTSNLFLRAGTSNLIEASQNLSHNHIASTNNTGAHTHTGTAASAGTHNHSASTNNTGGHRHGSGVGTYGTEAREVSVYGWTTGDMPGSGTFGLRNAGVIRENPDRQPWTQTTGAHSHSVTVNNGGAHTHAVTTVSAGGHEHSVTVNANGGNEARPRNMNIQYVMRIL